jgi:Skp family chaperone for outer membrane proteins
MGNDNDNDDKSATEELKVGFSHLVNAAKKAVKSAEPLASRAAEEVGSTIEKLNKGTEQVAADVGREVATLAGKLADKLRAVADRAEPTDKPRNDPNDPSAGGGI